MEVGIPSGNQGLTRCAFIGSNLPMTSRNAHRTQFFEQTASYGHNLLGRRRFSELAVFDARLYVGVRRTDEPG
jgi:hypothetical protein